MKTQRKKQRVTHPYSRRFASKVNTLATAVLSGLGSQVSSKALRLLRESEFEKLVQLTVDPRSYVDWQAFRDDYLAVSLLSKFPNFDLGYDLRAKARDSFVEGERVCSEAALRLDENVRFGSVYTAKSLSGILHSAASKIRRVLGPFSWDLAEPYFAFGPGATFTRKHCEGDPYYKYRARPCSTYGCAILAYTALHRVPAWYSHVSQLGGKTVDEIEQMPIPDRVSHLFELVDGNRVTFVPKSATKMRTIAIEPTMNGYIQHGLGTLMAKRLRRVGIDLRDQSRNQRLAREGSITGELATLDLSAASDSISMSLCKLLLPEDWFEAICLTRSEGGTLPDGTEVRYSKVSSMGNGFTFPLETLVFWALVAATFDAYPPGGHRLVDSVAVYGDDIIVPSVLAPRVIWVLEACGFSLNPSKSFVDGPFRESCGKHYFRGYDVTPVYVREDVDTIPRLIWFANQIRRWSRSSWGLDQRMQDAYTIAVSYLPERARTPSIPDGVGDYALFGDFDEATPSKASFGLEGWVCKAWLPFIKTREFRDTPFFIRQLARAGVETDVSKWVDAVRIARIGGWMKKRVRLLDDPSRVVPRNRDQVWRSVEIVVPNWPSYGPWV